MNENGVAQILTDVDFLENTFAAMGHEHLNSSFSEIRAVRPIPFDANGTNEIL